jgi:hypothetical protein
VTALPEAILGHGYDYLINDRYHEVGSALGTVSSSSTVDNRAYRKPTAVRTYFFCNHYHQS